MGRHNFVWKPFNNFDINTSGYVRGLECRNTNIVAYYISDKHNINKDFQLDGDFEPLRNSYGIYFLLGKATEANKKPTIYVGQASPREKPKGMDRLKDHANSTTEWYRNMWESIIYVTSKGTGWSTGILDTLEMLFIDCFMNRAEYTSLNRKRGKDGNIPEEEFITVFNAIIDLLPIFKYEVSEETETDVINSFYDKLVEMANDLKGVLKEDLEKLKAEYLEHYALEDIKRIEWMKQAEAYGSFKARIALAKNYELSGGRVLNGAKGEVITPEEIAKQMVDLIPADVFHSKAKFFDLACKSGIYIKCLIDRFMSDDAELPINHEDEYTDKYKRLKNLVENQLYGICLSRNGYSLSNYNVIETIEQYADEITKGQFAKSVLDSIIILPNIIFIDGYESRVKNAEPSLLNKLKDRFGIEDGDKLKFDVVIGNPPYNRGMDLDFVKLGFDLSTQYTVMITPAKWQTAEANQKVASKMSYGEFRKKLVPHMSYVCFYPDASDVFSIEQVDGVCFFCLDKSEHNKCTVVNKSRLQKHFNSSDVRDIRNRDTLHNIGNEIINSLGNYTTFTFSKGKPKRFQVWTNSQMGGIGGRGEFNKDGEYTYLLGNDGNAQFLSISRILDSNNAVNMGTRTGASTLSFTSEDKQECENFVSWLNTRFTRWFVAINISKLTGVINDDTFRFVPVPAPDTQGHEYGHPDFTFDHIYTDKELYEYYNLPQKYIDVIEAVIKERK